MKRNNIRILGLLLALVMTLCGCASQETAAPEALEPSPIVQAADALYSEGKYAEGLEQYLAAMEENIKDMDARLGAVKCLIGLENYELAVVNLSMAQQIAPADVRICELYLQMSQASDNISYARTASSLARKYNHTAILDKLPEAPVLAMPEGSYGERLLLDVTCGDAGAEIYVSVSNDTNSDLSLYEQLYTAPIQLLRGQNTVTAYTLKDGLPSDSVTAVYTIDYEATEVTFQEPLIEQIVRSTLNNPAGGITTHDCETINMLDWSKLQEVYSDYNAYRELRIASLEDLQYLPALTGIYLSYQKEIADYSPLRYCPRLQSIQLNNCDLTSADLVRYAPNVSYLYLMGNTISDFSALEGMTNLKTLYSYNNAGGSIDNVLRTNPSIRALSIDGDQLQDASLLTGLEELYYFGISGFSGFDTSVLTSLKKLEQLDISYNFNSSSYYTEWQNSLDLSFLQGMDQLTYLYVNGVKDAYQLDYIAALPNLQSLYLYNCDVTNDSSAMANLTYALPNCSISY